jgi:hypothetical protein
MSVQIAPHTAQDKLKRVHQQITRALQDIIIVEGRLLDFESAETLYRTLAAAQRELEEVQITVAVMERRVNHA